MHAKTHIKMKNVVSGVKTNCETTLTLRASVTVRVVLYPLLSIINTAYTLSPEKRLSIISLYIFKEVDSSITGGQLVMLVKV